MVVLKNGSLKKRMDESTRVERHIFWSCLIDWQFYGEIKKSANIVHALK
jgi:hypothetical protein